MLLPQTKDLILKALKESPRFAQKVLNEMNAGRKISAIKEIVELGRIYTGNKFGLLESKKFIEMYFTTTNNTTGEYRFKVDVNRFTKDVTPKGKTKGLNYNFDGIDLRQVNTKDLKDLYKSLRKELKKRGEKI